ncbi:hypothetical protein [Paenibacillus alvei]|uniref:Uncharacterized protein n=1 Tax=Paenibacillus alvei TaxID=44250 RepID=A0ABT4E627_PAEAL|nr:hypothetical protein [Paenibacillus alvei]EPY14719.1 hypothetical protein PAAL66ix_01389 [Paenibacillus alvei A6-6i-x]MCY9527811.1 hypothetical protein [Paenibacillus alvei]
MQDLELAQLLSHKLSEHWGKWSEQHGDRIVQPEEMDVHLASDLVYIRLQPREQLLDSTEHNYSGSTRLRAHKAISQWEVQQRGIMWDTIIPRAWGVSVMRMWLDLPLVGGTTLDVIQLEPHSNRKLCLSP